MLNDQRPIPTRPNVNDRRVQPPAADTADLPADTPFSRGPACRPLPRVADPLMQWSTGLPTKERALYVGWLIEAGKHAELDEAMAQAGFSQVTIKHGSGNLVTHWAVETANLFVVAEGVQSMSEPKHSSSRTGSRAIGSH